MNLDSSIAFIATLVASGIQSIDMVFFLPRRAMHPPSPS